MVVKDFGDRLCEARKNMGLSQRELAAILNRNGINVTNQAVSKWENGSSIPNAQQFLVICRVLDVTDIAGTFIGKSDSVLRFLNEEGRQRVTEYADMLRDSGLYDGYDAPYPRGSKIRTLPVYDISTDNTSKFLDRTDYVLVNVGNEVPMSANIGVRIFGHSMEPDYHDGEIVWIRQQAQLKHGDIGVFIYEGNAYFKRLRDRVGGIRLQSIDSHYPDIIVKDPERLIAVGKVVNT